MPVPRLISTDFGGPTDGGLLLLGPSVGTSARSLWGAAAGTLARNIRVVGWDLPGHGETPATGPFQMADLAEAVVALADEMAPDEPFDYAGNSIGGAVGLQLLLHAPERVLTASLLCTAAAFGSAEMWHQRAAVVRESGIEAVVSLAKQRWFAEHFLERGTNAGEAVIDALNRTDAESYALACEALAGFDVTDRLSEIVSPVLAVAGAEDVATPPRQLEQIATGVRNGRLVVLEGVAHLAPVEAPVAVADLVAGHVDSRRQHPAVTPDDG